MEQSDVEKWIGELEVAVDRLRSLYEQYFVGIEKIEPAVPRKDVDRRIYALRKEQIRNTALRFRFQMVLQRYNTYQTHWQRVCREIENGTYKRHMIRAQRRFGNSTRPPPLRGRSSAPPPPSASSEPTGTGVAAQLAALDRGLAAPPLPTGVGLGVPPALGRSVPPRLGGPPGARPPLPATGPTSTPATGQPSTVSPSGARPVGPPPLVWKKTASPVPSAPGSAVPSPASPVAVTPSAAPRPPVPPRPPLPSAAAKIAVPSVASTAASTSTPGSAVPSPAPPAASAPRPALSREAPPARPDPPRPASPPASPVPSDLSEVRLRQLYSELVDTKRRQNESTAAITYQSVAKSLRESSDRLRQKHGKAVDFEVTIKDGKAILRPVIK